MKKSADRIQNKIKHQDLKNLFPHYKICEYVTSWLHNIEKIRDNMLPKQYCLTNQCRETTWKAVKRWPEVTD